MSFGARIGLLGVLHTWSSALGFHPHVHYLVPAGGLSPVGDRWIHSPARFFLPVNILSEVFRGKFKDFLEQAYRQRKLELQGPIEELHHPVLFQDLIDQLYRHNWVVYAKEPFAGPEKVLQYLARYTHRVAISNDRLLTVDDGQVTFRYKDYAQGGVWRPMSLEPTEFIRNAELGITFVDSSSTCCHAVSCGYGTTGCWLTARARPISSVLASCCKRNYRRS